ncbi:MAG: hypothetical protein IK118_09250 [Clostridia bacterium]|nr:hypothetical protein [Clostridia bacterium]MBR5428520.1 hypothetical protein [Clostridia bacterium]
MNANRKRIGAVIVMIAVLLSGMITASAAKVYYGDADLNGKVQATDARRILRHAAKVELITDSRVLGLRTLTATEKSPRKTPVSRFAWQASLNR